MTIESSNQPENVLKLLIQFDEALAAAVETPTVVGASVDASMLIAGLPEQLQQVPIVLQALEQCRRQTAAELINQASAKEFSRGRSNAEVDFVEWLSFETNRKAGDREPIGRGIGRFQLICRLGSGGFGVVFLAEDPILQRQVALKIPRTETLATPELQRRFVRESQIAAKLTHQHLVPVYEAGQFGLVSYQVTAYCAGGNLASWLDAGEAFTMSKAEPTKNCPGIFGNSSVPQRQLSVQVAVDLMIGLADGVQYAHEHGILHRDLKPSNILLQPKGDWSADKGSFDVRAVPLEQLCQQFQPMVSDFGLAKLLNESSGLVSQAGGKTSPPANVTSLAGTPQYMAPEQLENRVADIGPPTDVYGLGAILYEVLAGRPVFDRDSLDRLRTQVIDCAPTPLRQLRRAIPADLEAICLKCLSKSPLHRYASAQDLADDLRAFARGEAIVARPWPWHERSRKWARRRPAIAALLIVTACLLVSLLSFGARHLQYVQQIEVVNGQLASDKHDLALQTTAAQQSSELARLHSRRSDELAWLASQQEYAAKLWRASELYKKQQLSDMGTVLQGLIPEWETASEVDPKTNSETFISIKRNDRSMDSRGFEWRYLWNQGINTRALSEHTFMVRAAALSPDGRRCFSIGDDGLVQVCDVWSGRRLDAWSIGLPGNEHFARISSDVTRAVVLRRVLDPQVRGQGWEVVAWDLREAKTLGRIEFPECRVSSIAISADGAWAAIGGARFENSDDFVELWHIDTGEVHRWGDFEYQVRNGFEIKALVVAPNGKEVAIGAYWHNQGGPANTQLLRATITHGESSRSEFTSCTPRIAGIEMVAPGEEGVIERLTFSPDGQNVAVATTRPDRIEVWDWAKRQRTHVWPFPSSEIRSLSFDATGNLLAVGTRLEPVSSTADGSDGPKMADSKSPALLVLWNLRTDERQGAAIASPRSISCVGFHEPSSTWVVGEGGGRLSLWSPTTSAPHRDLDGHRSKEAWGLAFSPNGKTLYTVGDDACLRAWDVQTGAELGTGKKHESLASCVAVSPNGRWIATGGYDDQVILWHAETLQVHAVLKGHTHDVRTVAFSPDSQTLASAGRDKVIRLWKVLDGEPQGLRESQGGVIRSVAFTPSNQIVEGNADGRIVIWEANRSFREVHATNSEVHCLSVSPFEVNKPVDAGTNVPLGSSLINNVPAGELLLCGCRFGAFRLIHIPTLETLFAQDYPVQEIRSVAISPDGRTFATAGDDNSVHLWHMGTGQALMSFTDLPAAINQIAFSPDGEYLAAALHDGTIRLWHGGVSR